VAMTDEEQIAYAMRMSMADSQADAAQGESMEVDDKDADYNEVINDPVRPLEPARRGSTKSEAVRNAASIGTEV
jgi:hypothetical protein